ncbi:Ti-type conjugative transfer relaxase TraA [Rhizobium sp. BK377]|uniref:Ti-type conjugative transfer relaxase TraA n=1 Tax=Rhizobium sp. BK377 TaxID=2587058 RepID=UPI00161CD85C|nr:Ti-type conjugative transfer relaxase TraA [Rhizobium sp. BK377]MBB3463056.1 Ti-type conjugative transfer relaxase TraA [Rhizobium sp. BK377]
MASHFSVRIVARGSGRSALHLAAYCHRTRMEFEREARIVDYSRKKDLLHEEFAIPPDAPQWLRSMIAGRSVSGASEAFWNDVESSSKRANGQLAKEITIGLPIELSAAQNIALMRDFVATYVTSRGMVADWVYHNAPGNPHVHLMITLRPLTEDGFGPILVPVLGDDGQPLRYGAGKIVYERWAGGVEEFNTFRDGWFSEQNRHLALAGLDIRADGRSFETQGIELVPTIHLGVRTKAIERIAAISGQPVSLDRVELQEELRAENASRIRRRPELVLDLITREKSVFDEHDVAKVLHRYIDDDRLFRSLMVRIEQSANIVRLDQERIDLGTGLRTSAKYTTREMIRLEAEMASRAIWLSQRTSHGVMEKVLEATFSRHALLSDEQRTALEHIAGNERIAAVIGRAGAGKTTMMKAAREAWEAAGYRVIGGALAGKAAEGLEKEAGIGSRTLSSWERRWSQGRDQLDDKTVLVLDEAGMVSSRQMAFFVEAATRAGAKLVLIGDPEQLQPIEAGAAFRAITDRIGYAELDTIYRQKEQWMRDASLALARGNIGRALDAYRANDKIIGSELKAQAVARLISDWSRDYDPDKTSLILTHLRRDVRALNEKARAALIGRGIVADGLPFETADGKRNFSAGDQIVFLKNDSALGVKNGMLGKVVEVSAGRIVARFGVGADLRQVVVEQRIYGHIDHGYATTIHKSQGATVDQVKLLASLSLDRHLTYVAMTRHREDLSLYYGRRSFEKVGGLEAILSRMNAKETTLDYDGGPFYRQALRFAESRGLHLVRVARSLLHHRLDWMVRQKQTLMSLATRLSSIGARLGVARTESTAHLVRADTAAKPMVSGITIFPQSMAQAIEARLRADPGLQTEWEDVSFRFRLVYAQPEGALKLVNIDAMVQDARVAGNTISNIANAAELYGALRGKTGLLASKSDKRDRQTALLNVPALAHSLERFVKMRVETARKAEMAEYAQRKKLSVEIPDLSPNARAVLERVRDAINRNDRSAALEYVLADRAVKAELEGFARAVSQRFGERTFLGIAAKDADGETFKILTAGMSNAQKLEITAAWASMRTVQQLSAHERTVVALKQAEAMRQTKSQGLSLK